MATITITALISLFFILDSFMQTKLWELNGSGNFQKSYVSPDGNYRADSFLINKGGATVGHQYRVSVTSLTEKKEFHDDTIYWLYPAIDEISIGWKDNNEIIINKRTININEPDTYYNWKLDGNL
ncbi:hypothetical protein BEP19_00585 [Ammoniphilus oxalaticus]|uniref:DUF5412 domain-containing protein n=1 Tax=Ammoniphilus oxalaticus TaxID=66863 RepID=A0A419SRF7_9BACL|nr:DUF5412 family protein [Ammoniphilus oxalaticus]RKD27102.1 hypothetical protein BEP19_00585 [Ammoniphilus oxalaticus]